MALLACGPAPPPAPPIEREIAAGEARAYIIHLPAGRYLSIAYRQEGIEIDSELQAPDGRRIAESGRGERRTLKRLAAIVEAAGSYRLTLRAHDAAGTRGRFRLELEERPIEPGDDRRVLARNAFSSGLHLWDDGAYKAALAQLQAAKRLWRQVGDRRGEVDAANEIGACSIFLQQPKRAFAELDAAQDAARDDGYLGGEAKALSNLAVADLFLERPVRTRAPDRSALLASETREALAIWRRVGDLAEEGEVASTLGYFYEAIDLGKAAQWYRRALSLRRRAGDFDGEANTLNGLGLVAQLQGDYDRAERLFLDARALGRRLRNHEVETQVVGNLAALYHRRGEPQKALTFYNDPLLTGLSAGPVTRAASLISLGTLYVELGELDQALASYRRVLSTGASEEYQLNARIDIGRVLLVQGETEAALGEYQQALAESRLRGLPNLEALALEGLGHLYLKTGQPRKALEYLEPSRDLRRAGSDRSEEAQTRLEIGNAYRVLGDAGAADRSFGEALALARAGKRKSILVSCLAARATLHLLRGELAAAGREVDEAIATVESERSQVKSNDLRVSFFSNHRSLYDLDIDILMELDRLRPGQGYAEAALGASERSHARGLLDLLAEVELGLDSRAAASSPSPLGAPEIERLLDERTALLEYSLGGRRSFLFVVTRKGLVTYPLPAAEEIEEGVADLRRSLERPSGARLARYRSTSRKLFRWLLPGEAAAKPNLLIVPDGALHLLPFEVLLTEEPAAATLLSRLAYLLRGHTISYVPSASVLRGLRDRGERREARPGARFLGFAYSGAAGAKEPSAVASAGLFQAGRSHAAARGPDLAPLPGVDGEVEEIASLFPSLAVTLYLDQRASRGNVMQNRLLETADRVHFAVHGQTDEQHPQLSGLVLAPSGPGDDGKLRMADILKLRLNADLVVLSACETGLGREVTGEGLVGLSRAFFYAGARSLTVSLWLVSDASTPVLMRDFYARLVRGEDKDEALRQAKLAMIARGRYAHPFYWAPFILAGDPR
ncbi:MAG TPA: CHAT domain-containing protein [Thermoanaerobaculia bacterium]